MKKLLIGGVLFFCLSYNAFTQNNSFNKPPVNILSPEVANLGKYGTYNVNYYTGTPGITVPIYELKESGVSIPISINYDASGFIPNKNSGVVGQNWSLTAGGAITRVVKGVPDEKHNPNPGGTDVYTKENDGYIYGIRNNAATNPTQSYVENLDFLSTTASFNPGYPSVTGTQVKFEYNPDIFSFNFLGHSGTFVMGNDGTVKVNSDRKYKVDLQGLKDYNDIAYVIGNQVQNNNLNNYDFSTIILTDDQGYQFYFGGKLSALEISFSYIGHDQRSIDGTSGVINAWYIKKVVAPNGEEINFDYGTYSADEQNVLQRLGASSGSWDQIEANFMDVRLFFKDFKYKYELYLNSASGNQPLELTKSLIKTVYLKKIESRLKTINFTYSKRNEYNTNVFYTSQSGGTDFETFVRKNPKYFTQKLDHISVRDNIGIFRPVEGGEFLVSLLTYDFTYQFYGNSAVGNRLFLKELISNVQSKYNFDYWRPDELQHPLTAAIDKWGFYNGQNNNTLIGVNGPVYGDPAEFETNFVYAGQNRTANPAVANIGLLKTITYPTGGTTEFEFEGHKVKKILKRKVNATGGNSIIPEWVSLGAGDDDNVGGCRIKKIINSPGTTTEFKYIKEYNINPNGVSSGLMTDYGVFRVRYERGGGTGHFHEQLFDQNITKASGISESPVCYSEVVEISGDGSEGYTKFIFTNPDDQGYPSADASPDKYYLGASTFRIYGTSAHVQSFENQMKRLARYSSRATERGKIWKKEVYGAAGNTILASTEYKYNRDPNRFNEKTVGYERIFNTGFPDNVQDFAYFIQSFHIYHYHDNPSQIIEKSYANGQVLTQTTDLSYKGNNNPLLTEKIVTQSDGSTLKSQYFYPEDRIGNPDYPASAAMVAKNMIATVIEEKTFQNAVPLQTNKYIYGDVTGTGSFEPVQTFSLNHTIAGAVSEEGMNITYYSDGNVKESFKKNDFKTAYIWDYKMNYPIAEVKNVQSASDISFSSFETPETWATGGYSQWGYNQNACIPLNPCPAGSKVFDLNYNSVVQSITRTGLNPAKEYIISLWFQGSSVSVSGLSAQNGATIGGWTYKEYAVTGLSSISITGTGKIDELRLYPKGSLMTTYTYNPLMGVTTQTDANNRITYYTYDNLARLTLIKDKDFNIIKQYCYNFYNQPVNCSNIYFRNSSISQSFTKNDCGEGYTGSAVVYNVPANTFGSNKSQTEADSLAQKSVLFYGQAYANANGTCTPVCNTGNCTGVDKKCINGVCETGIKKYKSSTFSRGTWTCIYIYEWSDCSVSPEYSETKASACTIGGLCAD